jgi:hypothetical protein
VSEECEDRLLISAKAARIVAVGTPTWVQDTAVAAKEFLFQPVPESDILIRDENR